MPSTFHTPVPPPPASPLGPPLAPPAPAPCPQPRSTHSQSLPAHAVAGDGSPAVSGTLHELQNTTVFSPERNTVASSCLSSELMPRVGMPSKCSPAPAAVATTGDGCRAPHITIDEAVLTSACGASPVTEDDAAVPKRASAEGAMFCSSPQYSTRTREWLVNQRRPRPIPHPSSTAASNNHLLRAGCGTGSAVVSASDVGGRSEQTLPPLVLLCASSRNAMTSAAPALLHSLHLTTSPTAEAAAPPSATVLHLPSSVAVTAARGRGENSAASACGSADAPLITAPSGTGIANDDSGAQLTLEMSLAGGLHSAAAPTTSSLKVHRTTRRGSPSTANVLYHARSACFGAGVGDNVDFHVHLNGSAVSCHETMPPKSQVPFTNVAAAVGGAEQGSGTAHRGESADMCPSRAAAGGRAVADTSDITAGAYPWAATAITKLAAAPRDYMHYPPSPPLSASRGLQPRQWQVLHGCGTSWPQIGSGVVSDARADVGYNHATGVVSGALLSPFSEELAQSAPTEEGDVRSPSAVYGQQSWSALQRGLIAATDSGSISGRPGDGAVAESQRRPVKGGGDADTATALAAACACNVNPPSVVILGAQQGRGEGVHNQTSAASSRAMSVSRDGVSYFPAVQREASHGRAHKPTADIDQLSQLSDHRKSARVILAAAYDAASRSLSEASKSWGESGYGDAAVTPWWPPTGAEALCNTHQAFHANRYHTATVTQWSQHRAMREVNLQHRRHRPHMARSKATLEAAGEQGGEDEGPQDWQPQTRCEGQQTYPSAPARQLDGAAVVSSLRHYLSMIPIPPPPGLQQQQQRVSAGSIDFALPFRHSQGSSLPASFATAAAAATPSSPPAAGTPPSVPPTFALFGALERLSRFSEMVQLCDEHADVLDDFLARLTLQLHRNSCVPPLQLSGASAAHSQSSSPPSLATRTAQDDCEFLRWHRIMMFLLRQPSELMKVGVEFFSDAVTSWPLHMLYLTCCFYVTAREHGFDALAAALRKGGIFCSGKGLFAALAVSMAQSEEDLIRSTVCMYRAAFYTGVLMRKRHQHFEAETRLTASGGFTLLVVNIPIITLRRLVSRVNEGYDVFAPMRDIKETEAEGGNTSFDANSNTTAVSGGTAPTSLRRRSDRPHSPTSSSGYASASSPFARSMPHNPHSVIEVSRVISSRSAVVCGHPLDMLRLDMILTRFADFSDVKIHKEYLPAGGPENSYFFNKHMAHELMGLWKARGVAFSLASVQLPLYSPVNGDLWAGLPQVPLNSPAPPDASTTTMASACDSNAIFCSAAPPPTEGYRDERWMFNVAEAATCANQDLTYSLRHMQDGSVLLDFSTHAIRIGRLIAWTNKSITVLSAPENRQESSAMPPPRRSPKDEAVRNTMEKLSVINNVLREVGVRIEHPPDALADPSVELFTTFTELGLLEVLHGPREHAQTCHFGAQTHAASVVLRERPSSHAGDTSTGAGKARSGTGAASEMPLESGLGAIKSPGEISGVASSNGPAAGRRMKPITSALASLNSACADNTNASILGPGSNLSNPNTIGNRHTNSLSLSSAGGVGGSSGLSATGGVGGGGLASFRSRHASAVDGSTAIGTGAGPSEATGGAAAVSINSFPAFESAPPLISPSALTSGSLRKMPVYPPAISSPFSAALPEKPLPLTTFMHRGRRRGSRNATGAAHPLSDATVAAMASLNSIPSSVFRDDLGATAAGSEVRKELYSATYTACRSDCFATHERSQSPTASALEHTAAASTSGAVGGGVGGYLWHTISPIGQSNASSEQPTPTTAAMPVSAVASQQPKPDEASVAGGASLSAPPAPLLSIPQEAHSRLGSSSTGRGHSAAAAISGSLQGALASAFSFPPYGLARPVNESALAPDRHILSAPSGRSSSRLLSYGTASSRQVRGTPCEVPVEGEHPKGERCGAVVLNHDSASVRCVRGDTLTHAAECFPLSMYERDFVIRRSDDHKGIVNVYQVSALITYYEMQFNCVLCDGAVLFAGLLRKASRIEFPAYTLLLCPTVFSLLELWDGYEFEELWKRSLSAPSCSRVT
ncbi:hypothetical protein LSCM4_06043 [Leishmania orientalis]|uniref:Starter acyltransferase (SAT) domain-containing protein n=1 Tax=Leishmania orientalis TaxID=2249476 RepID=A0A836KSK8_9TRYP|nr:hypothetical protein LSCM4_06043 [Leishmania orientalis]